MSLDAPQNQAVDGTHYSFAVVAARYNNDLVDALVARMLAKLAEAGVRPEKIFSARVPGSHEVPWAIQEMVLEKKVDAAIALGVLIGGDTSHHEMVGASVSAALQEISRHTRIPVINGVIVANTLEQARARCQGPLDRGAEFAASALEMAQLRQKISS